MLVGASRCRRSSCSGARKAQRVLVDGRVAAAGARASCATRHPSYDFDRSFMAEGSHFAATADLVDWWAIGSTARKPVL